MEEHGPTECAIDNCRGQAKTIFCHCGWQAQGDTWAEAGAEMDAHLEEHE